MRDTPNTGTPLALAPADILIPEDGLRRTPPSEEAEMGFAISVAQLGVLQPILVRGADEPGRYRLVAGRRRLRAAIAAGHATIPAVYRPDLSDADATAIEMAENIQRAAMAPLDQWRAIARLQELGWTDPQGIADTLGLPVRLVLRMRKLGSLHPTILAAIEAHGMPAPGHLHAIAAAPPETQQRMLARETHFSDGYWWRVAQGCAQTRLSAALAIFDVAASGLAFEEDLFAEPDDPDRFTTTDVAGFLAAQRAALEAKVAASKGRLMLAKPDKHGGIALPKGWTVQWGWHFGDAKLPRGCTGHVLVRENGRVEGQAAKPPAKKEGAKKSSTAKPAPADDPDDEVEEDDGAPAESPTPPPAPKRLTQAGRELLAELRTDGLRAALRDRPAQPETALAVLLLALAADNVQVSGERGMRFGRTDFHDIAAAVFVVLEQAPNEQGAMLDRLATEAAARILICRGVKAGNGSGDAAEWIGALIDADRALPRLDREELLAAMSAEMLAEIAPAHGVKPGKAAAMRRDLAGQAPALRLPEARFRAEPPALEARPVCDRMAGKQACGCGWKASDGEDAEDCALGTWQARMARLGLHRSAPKAAPPPEDHDAQRRADAEAFDGKPAGDFACGWTGDGVCRENGTTRCLRQCPRHEKYAAWIVTPAGKRARRAAENAEAKASGSPASRTSCGAPAAIASLPPGQGC